MKTKNPGVTTRTAAWATKVRRRMTKPWRVAAAIFPFLAATPLSAQQPGDTVRVSRSLVGVVVEADSAGLRLTSGYAPYAAMASLEVWGGTTTQAGRGFKHGLVVGGILGGVTGAVICHAVACDDIWDYPKAALTSGVVVGLLVGWAGALIGSAIKSDIWTPVPIPGGLSLRLAVGGT